MLFSLHLLQAMIPMVRKPPRSGGFSVSKYTHSPASLSKGFSRMYQHELFCDLAMYLPFFFLIYHPIKRASAGSRPDHLIRGNHGRVPMVCCSFPFIRSFFVICLSLFSICS